MYFDKRYRQRKHYYNLAKSPLPQFTFIFHFFTMKIVPLILLTLFSSNLFADYGVAKTWHFTQETPEIKCSITVVKLTSGKFKTETLCFTK